MSRTISQLDLCTSVWIEENGVAKEYFIIEKDAISTILLRKDCSENHRMHSSNTTDYSTSEMDTWLNDASTGFKTRFSSAVQSALQARSIATYNINDTELSYITRSIYLLSYTEAYNGSYNSMRAGNYIGGLIDYKCGNRIAYIDGQTSACCWWLRSPNSATGYWFVNTSGSAGYSNATISIGVRPALSVANATIVSDEGADIIYLLPEQRTYGEIDATIKVGESSARPKKARVLIDSGSMYDTDIKVTNNYGDATPTWVTANSGNQVTLANETKTTENWQIGVKIYGKSTSRGSGYFKEPTVLIETD